MGDQRQHHSVAEPVSNKPKIGILEKLIENRNYCVLCPYYKKDTIFKTKGALKFHLRIKHSNELQEEQDMSHKIKLRVKSNLELASPPPLIKSSFNPPKKIESEEEELSLAIEDDEEEMQPKGIMTQLVRESLPKLEDLPTNNNRGKFVTSSIMNSNSGAIDFTWILLLSKCHSMKSILKIKLQFQIAVYKRKAVNKREAVKRTISIYQSDLFQSSLQ